MAKLLFHLRDVPNDERDEVNALLISNSINYYETTYGNWGLSVPALWVKTEAEYHRARLLINDYQTKRSLRVRQDLLYKNDLRSNTTFWENLKTSPVHHLLILLAIALITSFSITIFPH